MKKPLVDSFWTKSHDFPIESFSSNLIFNTICDDPLVRRGPSGFSVPAIYRSGFKCRVCNKTYSSKNIYLDLTVTAGSKDYNELKPAGTELFRSPLVSFLYERGWRQNFNCSGFPGPNKEVKFLWLLLYRYFPNR
ncbi:unnamed protein product [Coffea canephora]|uniref:Uncharacterized protein n=1 Tax=Coffea canephora TaxID=49390 RepID=A0A068UVN5_COFCA|nr:unnamed protein product [Coffea canephora]